MVDMEMVQQVVGAVGVLTTNGIALTLLKPVFEARREGSLAGLDARLWPLNFLNQMLWTGYSTLTGDVWLFFSSLPAAVMWLFFCLTIVELLSQEEGELTPASPRNQQTQDLFAVAADVYNYDLESLHDLSKMHRTHLLKKTELFVCVGLFFYGLVTFGLTPDKFMGFPMLDGLVPDETRIKVFGFVCMMVNLACNLEPIKKVRGVIRSRDASSVFLPNVFGTMANGSVWFSYGVMTGNPGLIIPLGCGLVNMSTLLVLRICLGGGSKVDDETDDVAKGDSAGAQTGDVVGIQEAWGAICPSPVLAKAQRSATPPPMFGHSHKRPCSTSSNVSVVSAASALSTRSNTRLVGDNGARSAKSSTTGHGNNDIANLADLESGAESAVQSPFSSETKNGTPRPWKIGLSSKPQAKPNELPDLSDRLKDMGVYEDYLKWQRDYQKWRQGGARGAQGDVRQVGIPQFASEKAPGVIPEADVEKEMSMKLRDVEK